jgi:hypothetical protein
MAQPVTTATYEASPGEDADGVPVCRRECGAWCSGGDDNLGVCCIQKKVVMAGVYCRPVLLEIIQTAKDWG